MGAIKGYFLLQKVDLPSKILSQLWIAGEVDLTAESSCSPTMVNGFVYEGYFFFTTKILSEKKLKIILILNMLNMQVAL